MNGGSCLGWAFKVGGDGDVRKEVDGIDGMGGGGDDVVEGSWLFMRCELRWEVGGVK